MLKPPYPFSPSSANAAFKTASRTRALLPPSLGLGALAVWDLINSLASSDHVRMCRSFAAVRTRQGRLVSAHATAMAPGRSKNNIATTVALARAMGYGSSNATRVAFGGLDASHHLV